MGQWVIIGHGSNGSPFSDGSRVSWVTHDDEITAQWLAFLNILLTDLQY